MFNGSSHENLPRLSQRSHTTAAPQSRDCETPFLAELRRNLLKREVREFPRGLPHILHCYELHRIGIPS